MLFNSLSYLIFFPAIALAYFLIPWQKVRNILLLVGSYYFYMCWDPRFILLMLGCTVITYLDALFIDISRREDAENVEKEKRRTGQAKLYTVVTIVFTLAVVAWFKYANFLTETIVSMLGLVGVHIPLPKLNVSLPEKEGAKENKHGRSGRHSSKKKSRAAKLNRAVWPDPPGYHSHSVHPEGERPDRKIKNAKRRPHRKDKGGDRR